MAALAAAGRTEVEPRSVVSRNSPAVSSRSSIRSRPGAEPDCVPDSRSALRPSRPRSGADGSPGFRIASTSQFGFRASSAGWGRGVTTGIASVLPPCHSGAATRGNRVWFEFNASLPTCNCRSSRRAASMASGFSVLAPFAGAPDSSAAAAHVPAHNAIALQTQRAGAERGGFKT